MEFWGPNNNTEGDWSPLTLSETYISEESDFMAQLLSNCTFPFPIPSHEESLNLTSSELMVLETSSYHCSDTVNNASRVFHPDSNHENSMPMEFCFGGDEKCRFSPEEPRKRARESSDVVERKRNVRGRKKQKQASSPRRNEEDGDIVESNMQSPSSCSEDEPLPALNSNGKVRAGRGSATDPQSIYARKRRERINERLRILQKLIPNGTKVDISTMLAEAVQYVKFLQLQIKLLSSDDMWMYAPIAYNGMNLGLDI